MHILSVGTATPQARYTKAECLVAFEQSAWFARLDARAHFVARTVLQRDNGIEARRLAVATLDEVFTIDPDTLSARFLSHAPPLAAQAGERALIAPGWPRVQLSLLDRLDIVTQATLAGYTQLGWAARVQVADVLAWAARPDGGQVR